MTCINYAHFILINIFKLVKKILIQVNLSLLIQNYFKLINFVSFLPQNANYMCTF